MRGPPSLPTGWERVVEGGDVFYYDAATETSSWTLPDAPAQAQLSTPSAFTLAASPTTSSEKDVTAGGAVEVDGRATTSGGAAGDALVAAVSYAYVDDATVEAMLMGGAHHPAQRDSIGSTALHAAARAAYFGGIQLLVQHGAELSAAARETGEQPIHSACRAGKYAASCVGYLVSLGADVGAKDAQGRTALHVAAALSNATCASELLRLGAPTGVQDAIGDTPLHAACAAPHSAARADCVRNLLLSTAAAHADAPNQYGRTPRAIGAATPDLGALFALVRDRAAPGAATERGATSGDRSHLISDDSSSGDGDDDDDGVGGGTRGGSGKAAAAASGGSDGGVRSPAAAMPAGGMHGGMHSGTTLGVAPLSRVASPNSLSPNSANSSNSAGPSAQHPRSALSGRGGSAVAPQSPPPRPSLFASAPPASGADPGAARVFVSRNGSVSINGVTSGAAVGAAAAAPAAAPPAAAVAAAGAERDVGTLEAEVAMLHAQHARDEQQLQAWRAEVLAQKEAFLKQRELVIGLRERQHSAERELWEARREVEQLRAAAHDASQQHEQQQHELQLRLQQQMQIVAAGPAA